MKIAMARLATTSALLVLLVACATTPPQSVSADSVSAVTDKGFLVWLDEHMPDGEQLRVRMIVTDRFLRMDDGQATADYVLFDRRERQIFVVVNGDQSIQLIGGTKAPVAKLPARPSWAETVEPSHVLMRSDTPNTPTAQHYTYSINGAPCYHVVTVEGLLPEALNAWRDYKKVLANDLAQTFDPVVDGAEPCRAAAEILASDALLQHGFPLREWSEYGYSRFVQDYRWDIKFDAKLFELPATYRRYRLGMSQP